jgi:hypothetical protein
VQARVGWRDSQWSDDGIIVVGEHTAIFESLLRRPFPRLGKQVGDFPLYDSLLAGLAGRYLKGKVVNQSEVPEPDRGTLEAVTALRLKARAQLSEEERDFLEYFEHMEDVRAALLR